MLFSLLLSSSFPISDIMLGKGMEDGILCPAFNSTVRGFERDIMTFENVL